MIKYKSSDIINRAKQIADLEDSSFISWNENIALLNEAYSSFYQKIIDKDEGFFVKNFELKVGKNKLPNDFFQVKYVGLISGKSNTPILRRPKTDNFVDMSYDIQDDKIFINGTGMSGKIVLSYYAVPPTLTFPNECYDIKFPNNVGTLYDANRNNYAFVSENNVNVYNAKYNLTKELTIYETPDTVKVFENGIIYIKGTNVYKVDFNGNKEALATNKQAFISNDTIYINVDKTIYKTVCDSNINLYYIMGTNLYGVTLDNNGNLKIKDIEFKSIKFSNDEIYVIDSKDEGLINFDSELNFKLFIENKNGKVYKYINATDLDSGYGVLTNNSFTGNYTMESFLVDTELNFSNTFFFPIISYNLARSYKIKQGADFSGIEVKYNEVLQQFFDSISMDSNNCIRIANAY